MIDDDHALATIQTFQLQNTIFNNPIKKKDLGKLPHYTTLKKKDLTSVRSERCSVCLEQYKCREQYITLKCGHAFHKKCIHRWFLRYNRTCPVCRSDPFT